MASRNTRCGFTLIELLVVVAMIMLIAGAFTSAISRAAKRAKIQACITEAQHMTNAILAYENYAEDGRIPPINEYTDATRQNMKFILGEEKNKRNGEQMPVLFNAANMNPQGEILDPWHRPYRVRIVESKVNPKDQGNNTQIRSFAMFPNYNRRPASEVEAENE